MAAFRPEDRASPPARRGDGRRGSRRGPAGVVPRCPVVHRSKPATRSARRGDGRPPATTTTRSTSPGPSPRGTSSAAARGDAGWRTPPSDGGGGGNGVDGPPPLVAALVPHVFVPFGAPGAAAPGWRTAPARPARRARRRASRGPGQGGAKFSPSPLGWRRRCPAAAPPGWRPWRGGPSRPPAAGGAALPGADRAVANGRAAVARGRARGAPAVRRADGVRRPGLMPRKHPELCTLGGNEIFIKK